MGGYFVKSICMHAWSGDGGLKVVASFGWREGLSNIGVQGAQHTLFKLYVRSIQLYNTYSMISMMLRN